jgi:hypothetical protein
LLVSLAKCLGFIKTRLGRCFQLVEQDERAIEFQIDCRRKLTPLCVPTFLLAAGRVFGAVKEGEGLVFAGTDVSCSPCDHERSKGTRGLTRPADSLRDGLRS